MQTDLISPRVLALRLAIYFVVLMAGLATLATVVPQSREFFPFGGRALDVSDTAQQVLELVNGDKAEAPDGTDGPFSTRLYAALFLVTSLFGTIVLMIPITWV